ncbi:hypothetical protein BJV77DRAFT_1157980 [Russula vinacea]|nr:hypothetical protein BJV77DRAFT_1157980 [Russula vinacea]
MRAALRYHDRAREIAFDGTRGNFYDFFKTTNCTFPVLESLTFRFRWSDEAKIPDTFLRRRLKLLNVSLTFLSGFLLSATALTELYLRIDIAFGSSAETSLLACLQGMHCLCHLDLSMLSISFGPNSQSTPKDIVPLPKLSYFSYVGYSIFLDALVAGLSAPSLRDVRIVHQVMVSLPFVHLSRFINDIEEHYHAAHLSLKDWVISLSLLTQSEYISHCNSRVKLGSPSSNSRELIMQMSGVLSAMLPTVGELHITFDDSPVNWVRDILWRWFLQQFPNLKTLRTEGKKIYGFARSFLQDQEEPVDDSTFLPSLEQIELDKNPLLTNEGRCGPRLAALQRFISAPQQAGRPVKLSFGL